MNRHWHRTASGLAVVLLCLCTLWLYNRLYDHAPCYRTLQVFGSQVGFAQGPDGVTFLVWRGELLTFPVIWTLFIAALVVTGVAIAIAWRLFKSSSMGVYSELMNRKIPNSVVALIVGSLVLAFGCWAYFGDTRLRQARLWRLTEARLAAISSAVHAHPEFRDVIIGRLGKGGVAEYFVAGRIKTEKNLSELRQVIAAQQPPVTVDYYRLAVGKRVSLHPANGVRHP